MNVPHARSAVWCAVMVCLILMAGALVDRSLARQPQTIGTVEPPAQLPVTVQLPTQPVAQASADTTGADDTDTDNGPDDAGAADAGANGVRGSRQR